MDQPRYCHGLRAEPFKDFEELVLEFVFEHVEGGKEVLLVVYVSEDLSNAIHNILYVAGFWHARISPWKSM